MHQNLFSAGAPPRTPLGAYDAPPDPLVGWGGPIPFATRRLRRLELGAYGASVLRPPQHKILATPVAKRQTTPEVHMECMGQGHME